MSSKTTTAPGAFPLFGYERKFIRDRSRLKGWLKGRQIGGSTTATLDVVLDVVETPDEWHMMSRSQRQAKSLLRKAAKHVRAIDRFRRQVYGAETIIDHIGTEVITLTNGGIINAVPCDPDTTVGETTNWLIDEFALFPNSRLVYGVIKPSIMHGKKMRIISTPRGKDNQFADMWHEREGRFNGWSWHQTTLQDAINDGLEVYGHTGQQITFEKYRDAEIAEMGLEMFGQEYMTAFSDELYALLSWALVTGCTISDWKPKTLTELRQSGKDLYVGVDIGRRHDLTVIWILSRNGDEHTTEAVIVLYRTPFPAQQIAIQEVMDTGRVVGLRIDEQGNGMQLAEHFIEKYPLTAAGVSFNNANKQTNGGRVKTYMEAGNLWIPDDLETTRDLTSVQRNITATGALQLAAPQSGGGHADRFWALALALHASSECQPFELAMAG